MDAKKVAQIALNDQQIMAQLESLKGVFRKNPKKLAKMMDHVVCLIEMVDGELQAQKPKDGPRLLANRLAMIGLFVLFEHAARWEEEAEEEV